MFQFFAFHHYLLISKLFRVKSLSKGGNARKDQVMSFVPQNNQNKQTLSASFVQATDEDVSDNQQDEKSADMA